MSKTTVRHFNEGRACDAVLRFLEHCGGAKRRNLQFPERQAHKFPVDLVCDLSGAVIALEHTGTEPFEGHVKLQAESKRRVQPLVDAVASKLPPEEDFDLEIPLDEWSRLGSKELDRVSRVLAEWIVNSAPSLQIADTGRRIPTPRVIVPGVPFAVRLNRTTRYRGIRIPFHLIFRAGDLEAQRLDRMRRTLKDKCPKLAGWKTTAGAHTVLVLEWSDFQLTNPHFNRACAPDCRIGNRNSI